MKAKENNILGDLINEAIKAAYETGSGLSEDEETALSVTANWVVGSNDPAMSELNITIFQNDVVCLSYIEPETICRR